MLTRRGFAGFASCALCGLSEFVAAEASAQGAPPAATAGASRKVLSRMDGPAAGYETLLVEVTIEAGAAVARHTHPGMIAIFPNSDHEARRALMLRSTVLRAAGFGVGRGQPVVLPAA